MHLRVPLNLALAAEVTGALTSAAKAWPFSAALVCTPEGVLHPPLDTETLELLGGVTLRLGEQEGITALLQVGRESLQLACQHVTIWRSP